MVHGVRAGRASVGGLDGQSGVMFDVRRASPLLQRLLCGLARLCWTVCSMLLCSWCGLEPCVHGRGGVHWC